MARLLRLYVFIFSIFKGNFSFKRWCAYIWHPINISFANIYSIDPFKILALKGGGIGKVFLWLLLSANCLLSSAQSFPVQLIPQVTPPSPIYFSQYADASTTNSPLRLQIILNDLEISNREIRLKAYFQGNGISFQSNDVVVGSSPLFLEGGVPLVMTNAELAPYFRFENITGISPNVYGQVIPEGAYQFCYEVYDVLTGHRLSQKSCAISVVFQNEPPFLISPRNKTLVAENNPQNIVFQWTPRSINVSNVEYELSLVEIWDTQIDPQAAFLSSPPVFQTTTTATTYVYGPSDPLLLSGKNYAWRIQAKAKQGAEEIGLFKNQGYSEIFSFSYAGSCDLPIGIGHEVKGSTNANIFWDDFSTDVPEYTIRYRQKGNTNEWFLNKTTTNQTTLWDLKAGTTYEYQLQKKCVVTGSEWSVAKQFITFIADNEASVYQCGITPNFSLTNKEPLPKLSTGESFVAGDFPIHVLEISGSNGRFTGKGYVTIPYLNSIKVGVEFTNVLINTDKQMSEGTVVTVYDPNLGSILDVDEVVDQFVETYDAIADLGDTSANILRDVFSDDDEDEKNAPPIEPESLESGSDTINVNDGQLNITSNDSSSQDNTFSGNATDTSNSGGPNDMAQVTDTSSGTTTNSENEVVIVHNGTEYKNNEVIEVPYDKSNSNYAFLLKNHPEGSTFNWQVLYQGSDYTPKHVTNEPIHDNLGIDMKMVYILDIVANYNDQKIKVTIKRELEDFDLVDIYAKPEDSPQRIAKTGQKLYLPKSPTPYVITDRKVDFSIKINDNLSQGDISENDIVWYYEEPNQQNKLGKNYGKKNIHLNLTEQELTYSVNVIAGKPNLVEKGIDVVWFEPSPIKWQFMPPAVSAVLTKSFEDIEGNLKLLDKYIPIAGWDFKINPIKIEGSKYNEEDYYSRLYKKWEIGSVKGGISASLPKLKVTHPILNGLSRLNVADVGLYAQFNFSITARGGVERFTYIEHTNYENDNPFLEVGPSGCLEAGIEAILLVGKDLVDFEVRGFAKGCIAGKLKYGFNTNLLKGEFYIPPVVLAGRLKIKTKGALEFELVDWEGSINITEKLDLGEVEHQF
ncbi:fibronectin type III domain-containing protein [Arenibacter sp. F26102]|uniref:fibronectin type III domain-containing protein n=1 Tax=Arenibacter sp. F26102 TaxID=2926416 RepID=UPI001FF1F8A3|nr:fibronectin type III domain-containing protein [Arenibacter sp. F26102]MCK0147422.1 fibronectin type III domain-containing protein [Arenibacter sp. F26102]